MLHPEDACLELFLDWLAQAHGQQFRVEERSYLPNGPAGEPTGLSALSTDGERRLALEIRHLLPATEHAVWQAYRHQLEADIAVDLRGAYALWLPPGADLPGETRQALDFVQRVRQVAQALEPGQRSHVPLPVTLYLRKVRNEGGLMSVAGGLDTYWAKMSEQVRGSYDLDSTTLHRLPEDEEHRQQLLARICDEANKIQEVGQWQEIETVDAWSIQRLRDGQGVTIVGVPPEDTRDMGTVVRRSLRRLLVDAARTLNDQPCDLRALVILGIYTHIDQEGASTAMRGYDPTIYANLDFVCLASDARLKALMESPLLPWA